MTDKWINTYLSIIYSLIIGSADIVLVFLLYSARTLQYSIRVLQGPSQAEKCEKEALIDNKTPAYFSLKHMHTVCL
jgi:hypothetical protein